MAPGWQDYSFHGRARPFHRLRPFQRLTAHPPGIRTKPPQAQAASKKPKRLQAAACVAAHPAALPGFKASRSIKPRQLTNHWAKTIEAPNKSKEIQEQKQEQNPRLNACARTSSGALTQEQGDALGNPQKPHIPSMQRLLLGYFTTTLRQTFAYLHGQTFMLLFHLRAPIAHKKSNSCSCWSRYPITR